MPELAKYELLEELGHGGMATVYRARDRRLGREVAVKVIHPHLRDSREVVSRFHAEAKAVAKLRHPNIVDVYDVSEPDEHHQYIVVALVRGTTLRRLLQERGPMPPEIAAAIVVELLGALAHAHDNGVVHRDIKPENVLVDLHRVTKGDREVASGEAEESSWHERARAVVKLTDFGIAKLLDAQGVTSTGQVLGSPAHMAPEQIEGGDVDARSDVFGAGVLLYECMVGHLPFDGSNPAQVLRRVLDGEYPEAQGEQPVVGARWSRIIDRALAHAPADRFPDANAMRDALADELHRLGMVSPDRDLETWLGDASFFESVHRKKMIDQLCSLAHDARKRGDVLSAAADYNRALALAPDDPQLLRIVAGINRAERRARALRRVAKISGAGLAIGALGAGAARVIPMALNARGTSESASALQSAALPSNGSVQRELANGEPRDAVAVASAIGSGEAATPLALAASASAHEARRLTDRRFTLDMRPPMGVSVSIDGQPERSVATGDTLTLGTKGHTLSFSCPVCSAVQVNVEPGDRDGRLVVSVPVKPATLVIDGDAARTYQIVEHPELTVRAGPNSVPLKSAYEPITVKQVETGDSVSVRLEAAKAMHASFR